jgi:pyruvate-formate lyase-activating enzyme
MNLKGKICFKPWQLLELHPEKVYSCCPSWLNNTYIGETNTGDIFSSINSDTAQKIRQSILDGKFEYCNHDLCPVIKNNTLPTITEVLLSNNSYHKSIILNDIITIESPQAINLCHDRSCNLKCPSCRSNLIQHKKGTPEYDKIKKVNDQVLDFLHKGPRKITLNITGSGDPFGSPSYFDLLSRLDYNKNPDITVYFQTNGVLFDQLRWNKLPNIHKFDIKMLISLDAGIKEHYDKTRLGGDWYKLLRNLKFVKELQDQKIVSFVRLDMVVQKNNYRSINEFISIAKEHDFASYTSKITNWGTFSSKEFLEHNIFNVDHELHQDFIFNIKLCQKYDRHDWGNLSNYV